MPIYEYVCEKCGKLNDVLQKVNDPPPKRCNGCGAKGKLNKIVSRSSFVLRGGGWYADLYSSAKKESAGDKAKAKEGEPAKSEASPSSDAKPATSTESPSKSTAGKKSTAASKK